MRLPSLSVAVGALLLASPVLAQRPTSRPRVTPTAPEPTKPAPTTIAPAPGATGPLAGSSTMGYLQGVAVDSIHGTPLVNATMKGLIKDGTVAKLQKKWFNIDFSKVPILK